MAATLKLRPILALGRLLRAAALLAAALSWFTAAHAAPTSTFEIASSINSPETLADDREDDVTSFFDSGAYRDRLAIPLVAAGVLFAFVISAASLQKSTAALRADLGK